MTARHAIRARMPAALAASAALLGAACGDSANAEQHRVVDDSRLVVRYTDGTRTLRATLRCDRPDYRATGFLRRRGAAKLCRNLRELRRVLTTRPPPDRICAEIYGGPDRAVVTGRLRSTPVERRFSREDGCAISDWDAAQRILPRPTGAGG